ncbi:MAG TPA: HDOD domain-containing protein, partial [Deltaproteobacteria bacterium]|nr:HDOD domain-containing protein [Deltaproteobacteria bacterium]
FISATFYQFYAFMADHARELGQVFTSMPASGQDWVREFLPSGVASSIVPNQDHAEQDLNAIIDGWGYQERMQVKQEKGTVTLRKFRNIEHLFTLPSIASQVIALAQDEMAGAKQMAGVIESDPVITSKLLKVVNSAFYGFHRQIDSVEHAILILGNDEVINLAFSIAIRKILEGISPATAATLWEHSLMVAQLSQKLSLQTGCAKGEMVYTLGLLHDLGKIVMMQRGEFSGVLAGPSMIHDLAVEEEASGLTHAEIGAYVAERWQLPEAIVEGILTHHLPGRASNKPLAFTVHIADCLAHTGEYDRGRLNHPAAVYAQERELSSEKLKKAYEDIKARVKIILEA